jgi:hypothetical protein
VFLGGEPGRKALRLAQAGAVRTTGTSWMLWLAASPTTRSV